MPNETSVRRGYRGERTPRPDALIAELAARQHGAIARWQLVTLGLSHDAIDRRIAAGRLHQLYRGVFAVGHRRLTQRGLWMAAVLACGEGADLSVRAAGALWELRPFAGAEVTTPSRRRPPGIVVHTALVPPDERTVLDGIPVTTVSRTLFDLSSVLSFVQLERAFAKADELRLTDVLSVTDLLDRRPRARGTAALRAILADERLGVGVTQSEFEERFLGLLLAEGLPMPAENGLVLGERRDFVWRAQRLVVELDSRRHHDTRRGFENDRARDRALLVTGWRTLRITWRQLHTDPGGVARDLRLLLGRDVSSPRPAR